MVDDFDKNIIDPSEMGNENPDSDADIIKNSKNTLRYLRNEIQNRISSEVKNANESLWKALQSLDKWLLWEKEKTHKEIHDDLAILHRELMANSSSHNSMDRPDSVVREVAMAASGLQNHILLEAARDADPLASAVGKLMQFVLKTEK